MTGSAFLQQKVVHSKYLPIGPEEPLAGLLLGLCAGRGDRAVNHHATSVSCPSPKIGAWTVRAEGGKESGQ